MKLGKIVGAVLLTVLLTYSAITLFYTQSPTVLGLLFFIISAALATAAVLVGWKLETKDTLFIVLELLMMCAAISLLLGSLKAYQLENENNALMVQDAMAEIDRVSSLNDYHAEYMTYLDSELANYTAQNDKLYADVENENARLPKVVIVEEEVPYVPPEQPVVYQTYEEPVYEDSEEGYDDD